MTVDHIIPVMLGGKTTFENTVLCDDKCNSKKAALMPHEFIENNKKPVEAKLAVLA